MYLEMIASYKDQIAYCTLCKAQHEEQLEGKECYLSLQQFLNKRKLCFLPAGMQTFVNIIAIGKMMVAKYFLYMTPCFSYRKIVAGRIAGMLEILKRVLNSPISIYLLPSLLCHHALSILGKQLEA